MSSPIRHQISHRHAKSPCNHLDRLKAHVDATILDIAPIPSIHPNGVGGVLLRQSSLAADDPDSVAEAYSDGAFHDGGESHDERENEPCVLCSASQNSRTLNLAHEAARVPQLIFGWQSVNLARDVAYRNYSLKTELSKMALAVSRRRRNSISLIVRRSANAVGFRLPKNGKGRRTYKARRPHSYAGYYSQRITCFASRTMVRVWPQRKSYQLGSRHFNANGKKLTRQFCNNHAETGATVKTQDTILQQVRAVASDAANGVIERAVYRHRFTNGGVLGMEPRHWLLIPGCDARVLEEILELLEPYQAATARETEMITSH